MKPPEATIHLDHTPETPSADTGTLPETKEEFRTAIKTLEAGRDLGKIPTDELRTLNELYEKLARLVSPEAEPLSATYHRPEKDGTTKPEVITLDLESSVSSFTSFYQTHNLDLPPDFKERMEDIWNRNRSAMEQAIAEKGFDTILLVPGGTSLPDVHKKMTEGYNATYEGVTISSITEDTTHDRIILLHSSPELTDHPELEKTLNKSAKGFIAQGERLTLTEYLILQRKFFDETGKHLDETKWTWIPGSKSDALVVLALWLPVGGRLSVSAFDASSSSPYRGCRLSRCFV
jgi:hypothetical protein